MLSNNLFRSLPATRSDQPDSLDPDEEEPTLEPAWPHLQVSPRCEEHDGSRQCAWPGFRRPHDMHRSWQGGVHSMCGIAGCRRNRLSLAAQGCCPQWHRQPALLTSYRSGLHSVSAREQCCSVPDMRAQHPGEGGKPACTACTAVLHCHEAAGMQQPQIADAPISSLHQEPIRPSSERQHIIHR